MKNLNNFDASQQQSQPIWTEGHSQNSEARKKKKKIKIRKEEVRLLYISRKIKKEPTDFLASLWIQGQYTKIYKASYAKQLVSIQQKEKFRNFFKKLQFPINSVIKRIDSLGGNLIVTV